MNTKTFPGDSIRGGAARLQALVWALLGALAVAPVSAQPAPALPASAAGAVIVAGVVPDEATRQAVLAKTREVYGSHRVVDQLGVGPLSAPPNWSQHVQKLLSPALKQVSNGQIRIVGNTVDLSGDIGDEGRKQQLLSAMTASLNPTYTVRSTLRVATVGQEVLDAALANRIVEFQPGNAVLTPRGLQTLDELMPVLRQFADRRFEVIGHTDAQGSAAQNMLLSAERATTVKTYLVARGIPAPVVLASGVGADRPVADNATAEGRSRNRRIEFRVLP